MFGTFSKDVGLARACEGEPGGDGILATGGFLGWGFFFFVAWPFLFFFDFFFFVVEKGSGPPVDIAAVCLVLAMMDLAMLQKWLLIPDGKEHNTALRMN
jgi:hypothetical protein